MTTQLSTKFAALAIALILNGLMIGGVAYLFSGQIRQSPVTALAGQTVTALSRAV
jgi:uncharacterized membrane protein YjjP (DUF1212 family)